MLIICPDTAMSMQNLKLLFIEFATMTQRTRLSVTDLIIALDHINKSGSDDSDKPNATENLDNDTAAKILHINHADSNISEKQKDQKFIENSGFTQNLTQANDDTLRIKEKFHATDAIQEAAGTVIWFKTLDEKNEKEESQCQTDENDGQPDLANHNSTQDPPYLSKICK